MAKLLHTKPLYLSGVNNYERSAEAGRAFYRITTLARLIVRNDDSAVIEYVQEEPLYEGQSPVNAFSDHPSWGRISYSHAFYAAAGVI